MKYSFRIILFILAFTVSAIYFWTSLQVLISGDVNAHFVTKRMQIIQWSNICISSLAVVGVLLSAFRKNFMRKHVALRILMIIIVCMAPMIEIYAGWEHGGLIRATIAGVISMAIVSVIVALAINSSREPSLPS